MLSVNSFPLLDRTYPYKPDTIDLCTDHNAAQYWFECFKDLVNKISIQAAASQKDIPGAKQRAEDFKNDYLQRLKMLKCNGCNDTITIRLFLDLNESCLRVHGFDDPWLEKKTSENNASIVRLKSRLIEIDSMNFKQKWTELIRGVLAGNMFDWGAAVVATILETDEHFGLHEALNKIQKRPWLIDDLDAWIDRVKGPAHKCAVIFVDNSGVDIILGILPFTRELLKRRTKVILCANTQPSLNDVTYNELYEIVQKCCYECDILDCARKTNQLLIYENGQSGPCLDLNNLPIELCNAIKSNETDLLILEGMGRALHTNLNAKFTCETLKLAVVKNKWLANRLGGDTFSSICKYEKNSV